MQKLVKFVDFWSKELVKDYELSGHFDKLDGIKIEKQARAISEELIGDFPNLSLSNLQIVPRLIRKNGYDINWKSIARVLGSLEFQQELKDQIERAKKLVPKIENKETYLSPLARSVLSNMIRDCIKTPKSYRGSWDEQRAQYNQKYEDNIQAIQAQANEFYNQLLANGWNDNDIYSGER